MTVLLAAAFLVSIVAHYAYEAVQSRSFAAERDKWAAERRELLERIQRPDRIPAAPRTDFVVPEREPDEWNKVGSIEIDEKWLSGEDG